MSRDGSRTSDYDFELPAGAIAQRPAARRDESRLMVVDRASGTIEHRRFRDIVELIPPKDVLVVNATRVRRARLLGTRDSGAPAEILLLRPLTDDRWEAMVHPGGKLRPGRRVHVANDLDVEILEITPERTRVVRLITDRPIDDVIERRGHVPLPPYIERADEETDASRYQTVFARELGSVAAPTAGLHFTPEVLSALESRGVRRAELVLHVGAGTFRPVEVEDPTSHAMHSEWYEVPAAAERAVAEARANGGAVWAVGTTSARTLESAAVVSGGETTGDPRKALRAPIRTGTGETRLFIRPGYQWRVVDHLLTNFHLPRSTLIMLVAAFAGYELTMHAYHTAIAEGYRFYSYGDAMVIV